MRIAATGFVAREAGSIASANAILLKGLLERGHQVDFFSKSSFVDPRSAVGEFANFRFHECTNYGPDRLRRAFQSVPLLGFLAGRLDSTTYNKLLIRRISQVYESADGKFDVVLWMGDYAHAAVPGVPSVSFAQGAPGTDARSVLRHGKEIARVAGLIRAMRLKFLAKLRLSRLGLPDFACSDHIIVGSNQSKKTLMSLYAMREEDVSTMPYPVDLDLFRPAENSARAQVGALRVLWLGRIVPRKRLDLFLDGAAESIRRGADIQLTVVGGIGFVPGYERLLQEFPFPERLEYIASVPRECVPGLFAQHDVLCQPSDEEDFGSSVAEAQACGLPVIVGNTNGNGDYLCTRDVLLGDDAVETLAKALQQVASRTGENETDFDVSRAHAESTFGSERVIDHFENILLAVAANHASN
jgi:glycosyltransferase involved in cell wall biosynthesis